MRTLPRVGCCRVISALPRSSNTLIAPLSIRQQSTSESTLPAATNSVRWPLMNDGTKRASFSRSMISWRLAVAALSTLRSCSDSSRAGWLRSIVLVPKGLVSDGRQAVRRSSATRISATTSTSAPAPTSRPASPPRARGVAVATWTGGRSPRPDEEVEHLLRRALDLGITFFDLEDAGGDDGRGERLAGEAIRGDRDRITVATTFGYRPLDPLEQATSGARRRHDWSIQWAARAIDGSLSRLGVEPIDLWQLHHPDLRALESDELFDFLEQQVVKGKIRAYGVALGPGAGWVDEGAAALRERGAASARTVFSVFEQNPGRELAEIAAEAGAGVVVRSPLDARTADPRLQHLDFLTMDRDQTLGQALVRFALTLPAVAAVLPTFDDAARLAELATASDLPDLTADDLDRIAERLQAGFRLDDQDGRPAREAQQ